MGRVAQRSSRMHGKLSSQCLRAVRYVDDSDKQAEVSPNRPRWAHGGGDAERRCSRVDASS